MQHRKARKTQLRCTQQPDYAVPRLPEIYRKPLSWGHLAITDEMLVPKGVRYRGVPLYTFPCMALLRSTGLYYSLPWLNLALPDSTTLHCTMTLLGCTTLYYTLPEPYLVVLDSTTLPWLYLALLDSVTFLVYHGST